MKKIAVLFAFASLTAVGCVDNERDVCIRSAECAEEADPSAFCDNVDDDGNDGDPTGDGSCDLESDLFNACLLTNGSCDDVGDVKVFGAEASAAGGECETESADFATCLGGND